ncbi:SIP domain-containing protein [Candidatus Corynebacterium faecigallinarum]|uniref:SIP domain-containing protein n=1 Tax=Candidatus Corynebacterium faecigallinarum TaxID=2838528 RepID=UPI003FB67823
MPKTSRRLAVHPISLRELQVVRTTELTPGLRRLTLTGPELNAFTSTNGLAQPAFRSDGFDDDIRLIFPYPGKDEPVLPVQDEGHLDWPKDPRALSRVYTVRRWNPETGELDVDFIKHGTGIATSWAYRAQPGDRVHVAGPAASLALPDADWLLVAGDDTALPAIARLLEELPADAKAQVFIEIAHTAHRLTLRELPGVRVSWLVRDGAPAGSTTLLLDAVKGSDWWDGAAFAWIAGESAAVKAIRRHLVEERGLAKQDVQFTGYWRCGEVITLENDPTIPDPERNEEAFEKLHQLTELLPPLAIRAAVALDLPELIARGITSATELASRANADPIGVGKLLRYLHALDLTEETEPGHYRLTEVGDILTDDFVTDGLHPDGATGRREAAFFGLTEALRTGSEAYTSVTGQKYASLRTAQWYEDKLLNQLAKFVRFLAEPLAQSAALKGLDHVVVRSDAAGVMAQSLVAHHPHTRVTIAGLPSQIAWFRADLPDSIPDFAQRERVSLIERSLFETTPAADAVLLNRELAAHNDADAAHALRRAAESLTHGGRILLIEDTFDAEHPDEHDGEADLLNYALHGTGLRTKDELHAVISTAGLAVENIEAFGWGGTLHCLTPQLPG